MLPIQGDLIKRLIELARIHQPISSDSLVFILGQPKILRMEVHAISQDSPRLLDRMRAEIRVRHYSIR